LPVDFGQFVFNGQVGDPEITVYEDTPPRRANNKRPRCKGRGRSASRRG
jgi:hypothetical protein